MTIPRETLTHIKQLIPPLRSKLHKGQSGRVGVIGGALEATGATFFAAISSLHMGADICRVICSPNSASAIKSLSSDLVVHPILEKDQPASFIRSELDSIFRRLDAIIIGPGLGREETMQQFARFAFLLAKEQDMYVVLDDDALWMVQNDPSIMTEYHKVVLTPSVGELQRLSECLDISSNFESAQAAFMISRKLGGATILQKGPKDLICFCHPDRSTIEYGETIEIGTQGGPKRSGGQGNILAGVTATMLAWAKDYQQKSPEIQGKSAILSGTLPFFASIGGSMVTRTATKVAFARHGRGMVTQDILGCIGGAFEEVFGDDMVKGILAST